MKICPNCGLPLSEHIVVESPTLNRRRVYVCPRSVCPVEELFAQSKRKPDPETGDYRHISASWFSKKRRKCA